LSFAQRPRPDTDLTQIGRQHRLDGISRQQTIDKDRFATKGNGSQSDRQTANTQASNKQSRHDQ
jgi:hypothetical protein